MTTLSFYEHKWKGNFIDVTPYQKSCTQDSNEKKKRGLIGDRKYFLLFENLPFRVCISARWNHLCTRYKHTEGVRATLGWALGANIKSVWFSGLECWTQSSAVPTGTEQFASRKFLRDRVVVGSTILHVFIICQTKPGPALLSSVISPLQNGKFWLGWESWRIYGPATFIIIRILTTPSPPPPHTHRCK